MNHVSSDVQNQIEVATLGAGCFWCVEAVFQQLNGVISVESGYSGGTIENPTYKEVCSGETGHAEVAQITYNPKILTFEEVLEVFWKVHDPTSLNRQGEDVGTQYRSAIFYHNDEQLAISKAYIQQLNEKKTFGKPIVTTLEKFEKFYKAEDYHQNYFNENGDKNPYCTFVVRPKVEKFKKEFREKLK